MHVGRACPLTFDFRVPMFYIRYDRKVVERMWRREGLSLNLINMSRPDSTVRAVMSIIEIFIVVD